MSQNNNLIRFNKLLGTWTIIRNNAVAIDVLRDHDIKTGNVYIVYEGFSNELEKSRKINLLVDQFKKKNGL